MELPAALCRRGLERLVRVVAAGLGELAGEVERGSAGLAAGPALPFLAGQRRVVNAIRHIVVADILERLR